jgi:hypothetical protein
MLLTNITATINKETKYISSDNIDMLYQLQLQKLHVYLQKETQGKKWKWKIKTDSG